MLAHDELDIDRSDATGKRLNTIPNAAAFSIQDNEKYIGAQAEILMQDEILFHILLFFQNNALRCSMASPLNVLGVHCFDFRNDKRLNFHRRLALGNGMFRV